MEWDLNKLNKGAAEVSLDHEEKIGTKRGLLGQRIGVRLLTFIVLFSSLVTLISTLSQLYFDYRQQVSSIESRMSDIEKSYAESLAAGLWNVDPEQLQLQLNGIVRLSDIRFAQVREVTKGGTKPLLVTAGQPKDNTYLRHEIPLIFASQGSPYLVGYFTIGATLDDVYARLINTATIILISQGIKTFLVSMFILYVFYRLVTRHIVDISLFLYKHDSRLSPPCLSLRRVKRDRPDELDRMVEAINAMSNDLYTTNLELAGANAELESDIALRQAKEQEMSQMIEKLVEANAALDRFAYIASHDLKEPLRNIISFVQLLSKRYKGRLDQDADEYIEFAVNSAQRMYDLINDLMVFSSLSGKEAKFSLVPAKAVCEDAINNLRESIKENKAEITVDNLPEVQCDAIQLMEVFQNLIGNAIKFHRPGAIPKVMVTAEEDGNYWRFAVSDNGIGVASSKQDIFEIFRRLHTVSEYPGTGIGLAICKSVVQRHQGRIWFESVPGVGTTFYFTLPRS
jgi:signal transduction histidine kinase